MAQEFSNFLLNLTGEFKNTIKGILFYLEILYFAMRRRLRNNPRLNYPKRASLLKPYPYTGALVVAKPANRFREPTKLRTSLIEQTFPAESTWADLQLNDDPEVNCSVYRWYWLIYDREFLDNADLAKTLQVINDWINHNPYIKDEVTWQSYNVSERISSFVVFFLHKSSIDVLRETIVHDLQLNDFFSRSIDHLTKNLEYYPGGVTYNHVVNNLKGILTAAIVCKDEVRLNAYSALFFQELAIIVGEDGMLREGSSHYQFIVTRWICEIEYLFMKAKYKDGSEKIAKYSRSMLAGCHFFLVKDKQGSLQIPLIGDISPDFDPDWIIDYICGCYNDKIEHRSYGHLILAEIGYANLLKDSFEGHKTVSVQRSAEVTRVVFDDTDLFISHAHKQGKHFPNHAHDDFGSYFLFFNGKEFIGDRGRIDYKQITESKDYMLSESHNVIAINNFPVIISEVQRHYFPPFYLKAEGDVNVKQIKNYIEISVSTNAVKRIKSSRIERYERIYSIRSNTITISDHLYGTGNISVKGQIILHPSCDLAPSAENSYLIRRDGLEIDTSFTWNSSGTEDILYAKRYGYALPSTRLGLLKEETKLPFSQKIVYKLK